MHPHLYGPRGLGGIFLVFGLNLACSAASEADGSGTGGSSASGGAGGSLTGVGGASGGASGIGGASGGSMGTGGNSSGGTSGFDCAGSPLCTAFDTDAVGSVPTGFTAVLDYGGNGSPEKVTVVTGDGLSHSAPNAVKVDGTNGLFGLKHDGIGETYHLRVWLKIESLTSGNPVIVGLGGDHNSEMRMRLFKSGVSPHYVVANAAAGDGLSPRNSSGSGACPECVAVPSEWFCLRMYVDGPGENLKIWVNETQAVDLVDNAPWHSGGTWPSSVSSVRIGATALNGGGAVVYVDDLALDTVEIPCE